MRWGLGQTNEQLKLKYDVSLTNEGKSFVNVDLTIDDEGRLKPLFSVDVVIFGEDYREGEGRSVPIDLHLQLAKALVDGKLKTFIGMKKEWAERAVILLQTATFNGKEMSRGGCYHKIRIADYMQNEQKKDKPEGVTEPVQRSSK
jgi:hypothetical protein